jgi:hypothetical protein
MHFTGNAFILKVAANFPCYSLVYQLTVTEEKGVVSLVQDRKAVRDKDNRGSLLP